MPDPLLSITKPVVYLPFATSGVLLVKEELAAVESLGLPANIVLLESFKGILLYEAMLPILWLDQIGLYDFLKEPLLLPEST